MTETHVTAATVEKGPRSLRDYTKTLRRHRWMILVITVVAAAAAVALSVGQKKQYTATATMNFVDPTRYAGIISGQASPQAASTFAATGLDRTTQDTTLLAVKGELGTRLSVDQIRGDLSAAADPTTNLVTITGQGSSPQFTADLVNADVKQTKASLDADASAQFARLAAGYRHQLQTLSPSQRANDLTTSSLQDNVARAEALASGGATAAEVVSSAQVPSSPSSPKPVADGIIGGLLGFILALIVTALRESFDRRLRGTSDVENELDLPFVGHIRKTALGKVASATDNETRLDPRDLEAFRILRTNVQYLVSGGAPKTILVTSALPEEGKTTVASTLAFASAAAGRRTLLVECDLRRPTLTTRLQLEPGLGLPDFLRGHATPHEVLRTIAVKGGSSIDRNGSSDEASDTDGETLGSLALVLAGAPSEQSAELLASSRFRDFLHQVSEAYDLVVLDSPPLLPVADALELIPQVDAVLLCVRVAQTTRDQARAAKAALDRFPPRPVGIVVTGTRNAEDDGSYYAYTREYATTS